MVVIICEGLLNGIKLANTTGLKKEVIVAERNIGYGYIDMVLGLNPALSII